MRPITRLTLLALLLTFVSACTLNSQPTVEPLPTTEQITAKPVVSISSPLEGATVAVGTQLFVTANATDSVGVTRVMLTANGQTVKTVSSENPSGLKEFQALLDYTPRTTGNVSLQVIAYRGALASDPASVNIVVGNVAQPTATPAPSSGGSGDGGFVLPYIDPNDPTCRALTTSQLNLRTGPATTYQVITVLPAATFLPIIGRAPANDWWQVQYGVQQGWVSAQYAMVYGNCAAIPVRTSATNTPSVTNTPNVTATPNITKTPTPTVTPGVPDLVISNIAGAGAVSLAGGAVQQYTVTITNTGNGATGTFRCSYTGQDGVETELGIVSGLNAGESIALVANVTFTTTGSTFILAKADVDNQISEISEVNNSAALPVNVGA